MTRDEYNRKVQDVQEIGAQTGLTILRSFQHINERTGEITSTGFMSNDGVVFEQKHPFTAQTEYRVDEHNFGKIVYRDPTQ